MKLQSMQVESMVLDVDEFKRLVRDQAKGFGGRVTKWMVGEGSYYGSEESNRFHRANVVVSHVVFKSWEMDAGCWVVDLLQDNKECIANDPTSYGCFCRDCKDIDLYF